MARIFCIVLFGCWTGKISSYTINKCCPDGEKLDFNLTCTPISLDEYDEFSNSSLDSFDWFPIGSIVNASTLKIHQNQSDKYLRILKDEYEIKAGFKPICEEKHWPEVAHIKFGLVELFHFLLYDNHTFRIHISKLNSLHDREKDYIEFEKTEGLNTTEYEIELHQGITRKIVFDQSKNHLKVFDRIFLSHEYRRRKKKKRDNFCVL